LLVARGFLSEEQLEVALEEQSVSGRRLGEILVERGFIPHSTLSLALAEQYGIHPSVERGFGTGLRVLLQRSPDGEPQVQTETATSVVELVSAPEPPHVTHLEERLEEQWAQLAAVQEQLAAAEQELHALHRAHDRRRAQARRLLGRLRAEQPARRAALEQLALSAQDLHSLHRLHERRRAQAGRLLGRLRAKQSQLVAAEQELESLHRVHERRHAQAGRLLAAAEQELHSLRRVHDRRRAQAGRLLARLRAKQPELVAVRDELAWTEEALRAANRLHERRRAQALRLLERRRTQTSVAGESAHDDARGHLLFIQLDGGYELLERDGRPPTRDAELALAEIPETRFVVTNVGRSPLPNDSRVCAFAQRAPA
jgi:hypothetical protein